MWSVDKHVKNKNVVQLHFQPDGLLLQWDMRRSQLGLHVSWVFFIVAFSGHARLPFKVSTPV